MSAEIFAGIAKGTADAYNYASTADIREANLKEAKARQKQSELQLQEYQADAPVREAQRDAELRKLYAANMKDITIRAFDKYEADNDVRHLNRWLEDSKANPLGLKTYGEVARYGTPTIDDKALFNSAGINLDESNLDFVRDNYVVVTNTNGNQVPLSKETMYGATNYTQYMGDRQLERLSKQARINQMLRSGQSGNKIKTKERVMQDLIDRGLATGPADAYEKLLEMESSNKGKGVSDTAEERQIQQIMDDQNVGYLDAYDIFHERRKSGERVSNEEAYVRDYQENNPGATREEALSSRANLTKTKTQKELQDSKTIRTELDKMNWLDTPLQDMDSNQRARVYRDYIGPLEQLTGFSFNSEEKREIRNLRNLIQLGSTAGEKLTEAETGLIDTALNKVKKYFIDSPEGKEAMSSYETFRNVYRNALFGATLTATEVEAFNNAAGNLSQQLRPVLAQLQVQMQTVKNNLEAIRDLNDPDIAHYYLGMPIDDIDDAIVNLDQRINLVGEQAGNTQIQPTAPTSNKPFNFDDALQERGL